MNYFIQTYGCQMNAADSDSIAECFAARGMMPVEDLHEADLVVVNTCAVRQQAENRAYSFLGRLRPFKAAKPALLTIFVGCIAERLGDRLQRRFPIVDLMVGARQIERFAEVFDRFLAARGLDAAGGERRTPTVSGGTHRRWPVSSFVTIMRGCENFCAYCIVPYVRGREHSRPVQDILEEIRRQVAGGMREVTLLGQNVNSYHDGTQDFPDLLAAVNRIDGLERIRFMTSHPKDLNDKLIAAMASVPKVCEHMHLALQSGSDRMLAAMNRRYTAAEYLRDIEKLRAAIPSITITTDILVGFPGETDADFAATIDVIRAAAFDSLFAFRYSPRPGTAAAALVDDVPGPVKEARLAAVLTMADRIFAEKNATIQSRIQEILVEEQQGTSMVGRTRGNRKVYVTGVPAAPGRLVSVTITGIKSNSLLGTSVSCAPA